MTHRASEARSVAPSRFSEGGGELRGGRGEGGFRGGGFRR